MDSVFRLSEVITSEKELTHAVLQASQMLMLLNAELARILKVQCGDIGSLTSGKTYLESKSIAWTQAQKFIEFYNLVYDMFEGDAVSMRHWLRSDNKVLKGIPLLLIIDDGRLTDVMSYYKINNY